MSIQVVVWQTKFTVDVNDTIHCLVSIAYIYHSDECNIKRGKNDGLKDGCVVSCLT